MLLVVMLAQPTRVTMSGRVPQRCLCRCNYLRRSKVPFHHHQEQKGLIVITIAFLKHVKIFIVNFWQYIIFSLNFNRRDHPLVRSPTPNTLLVQIPFTGSGVTGGTVTPAHSMPNVSNSQIVSNSGSNCKNAVEAYSGRLGRQGKTQIELDNTT